MTHPTVPDGSQRVRGHACPARPPAPTDRSSFGDAPNQLRPIPPGGPSDPLASNDATGKQGHGHGTRYRCPEVEEDHMIRATISDVTPQTSLTTRDRWGRIFASLVSARFTWTTPVLVGHRTPAAVRPAPSSAPEQWPPAVPRDSDATARADEAHATRRCLGSPKETDDAQHRHEQPTRRPNTGAGGLFRVNRPGRARPGTSRRRTVWHAGPEEPPCTTGTCSAPRQRLLLVVIACGCRHRVDGQRRTAGAARR